jgi:hypothetical protein
VTNYHLVEEPLLKAPAVSFSMQKKNIMVAKRRSSSDAASNQDPAALIVSNTAGLFTSNRSVAC